MPSSIPRPEHPRPDFARPDWLNLNGIWQFAFDDADAGLAQGWQDRESAFDREILVPFCYQCQMSGIGEAAHHSVLWYRRAFSLPEEMRGRKILLRFGAVDYRCQIYVNGRMAGARTGGYEPFALEVTPYLKEGENALVLRVEDARDLQQPRGKQNWQDEWFGCWYTPVSGIWQTVYLEAVGENYLTRVRVTPDIDRGLALVELALDAAPAAPLSADLTVSFAGRIVQKAHVELRGRTARAAVDLCEPDQMNGFHLWSPEQPSLYDLRVEIAGQDRVDSYFGMRKVEVLRGKVLLNNQPYYQRLVLDQGYWPESLLTPPSDEALRADVEWTLKLGYNGARKHQKMEDPRYYYWADKLGLLVWGEVPSAYQFGPEMVDNLSRTLSAFIERDYNHPSIVCWVPLNESWGVPRIYADQNMQEAARMLYHQCKAQDGTRLVSVNDGWEQVETDICALHDYAAEGDVIARHFARRAQVEQSACDARMCYAAGAVPTGEEAFLVTEYGGIAFDEGGEEAWGYHDKVQDEEAFFARFQAVTDAIRAIPYCEGYCYTQLTDVQQEINGLLTPNRQPKIDVARLLKLNRNPEGR